MISKNKNLSWLKENKGFSILEIILASALFTLFAASLGTAIILSEQTALNANLRLKSAYLAEEGLLAIRNLRNENFSNIPDGNFGLNINNNTWELTPDIKNFNGFVRTIYISSLSTSTKEITVNVHLENNSSTSVSLTTRLTNWKNE